MKKVILGFMVFASVLMASPKTNDIYSAVKTSQQSGKLVVYVVMSDKCPHCVSYWNNTISDPDVTSILDYGFEFSFSNLNQGGKVPSDLPFRGQLPTTYILNSDGSLVGEPIEGNIPKEQMHRYLLNLAKARNW